MEPHRGGSHPITQFRLTFAVTRMLTPPFTMWNGRLFLTTANPNGKNTPSLLPCWTNRPPKLFPLPVRECYKSLKDCIKYDCDKAA
jgi:hypothetical protein